MGQKLVRPQKLVAFAHLLAVAVHDDEDRAAAVLDRTQHVSGQANGLVHADSGPIRDADDERPTARSQRA